eukprot:359225_1
MAPSTEIDETNGHMSMPLTFIVPSAFGQKHMIIGKYDAQSNRKRYLGWFWFFLACIVTCGVCGLICSSLHKTTTKAHFKSTIFYTDYSAIATTNERYDHSYPHSASYNHYPHVHRALSSLVVLVAVLCLYLTNTMKNQASVTFWILKIYIIMYYVGVKVLCCYLSHLLHIVLWR